MRGLFWALVAFSLLFLSQLVVWRIWRPTKQYAALVILSICVLLAFVGGSHVLQFVIAGSAKFLPVSALDYFNFVMLYTGLVLAYFASYPPIQAVSPSMAILLQIERAGPGGLALKELMDRLNDQVLIKPRLDDLVNGNVITCRDGRYVIGPRGALLAKTYIVFRAVLKMEKGG